MYSLNISVTVLNVKWIQKLKKISKHKKINNCMLNTKEIMLITENHAVCINSMERLKQN